MFGIDTMNAEEELRRVRLWKTFTPGQKHMALMYIYRLKTDSEHILDYLETLRFLKTGYSPDDLPTYVCISTPEELYREAYEVIGQRVPERQMEVLL